jgi:2-aminomuconate deaminase
MARNNTVGCHRCRSLLGTVVVMKENQFPQKASEAVTLAAGPKPRGRFPHARRAGDYLFVSGTSARNADGTFAGAEVDPAGTATLDIRVQTKAVLENIARILEACGSSLSEVVDITTFLVSMNDFGGYNEVYGKYFDETGPARTTVAVHQLPHPLLLIEIKATAFSPTTNESITNTARPADEGTP